MLSVPSPARAHRTNCHRERMKRRGVGGYELLALRVATRDEALEPFVVCAKVVLLAKVDLVEAQQLQYTDSREFHPCQLPMPAGALRQWGALTAPFPATHFRGSAS